MKVRKKPIIFEARVAEQVEYIETLEGTMKADVGDYIITGVDGEHWPVKSDIFNKTYDVIEQ